MQIQLITEKNYFPISFEKICRTSFANPRSIDEFDLNIVDLSCDSLWCYAGREINIVNHSKDFASIQTMIRSSQKATVLYILPRNIKFTYSRTSSGYSSYFFLKDEIGSSLVPVLRQILFPVLDEHVLQYEITRTKVGELQFEADFFFKDSVKYVALTKSDKSEKTTTIAFKSNRFFATTLHITDTENDILHFIDATINSTTQSEYPDWFSTIVFDDDIQQIQNIEANQVVIEQAQHHIEQAQAKLSLNDEYKSILYTNGDELVRVVYKILQQLLSCDLSAFVDEKREDFLIKKEECTFIGEIKGVNTNVRYEHVTQCNLHLSQYMDQLEEQGKQETVKQLLIINPFRKTDPAQRDPVHEKQIQLAIKSDCLIIETATLLRVFEAFLAGSISVNQCLSAFINQSGLLNLDMFNNEE